MDYTECLKIHGYIVDKSDRENSNVEEIYNKYKPTPVPYNEFKHRVVTLYADGSTTSASHNTSTSSRRSSASLKANPSATVQRNRSIPHSSAVARPVSDVTSVLQQQQLDEPNTVRGRNRVKSSPVVPPQPVYTLTSATNTPVHNTWTERKPAEHSEPARPPSPRNDTQVPYQPLVTRRQQQQQQREEEMNDCCCCIC
ncbi:hypothetical protein CBL_11117 [Carabus blaptoides fortunei]